MPHDERRMAHHVVEHAATLQLALPEPRHVRSAVLLGRAGQIWASRRRGAARPEQHATALHVWREDLVLEIAGREPDALHQLVDLLRFGDVAREWLLAGDAPEIALAALHRLDDLLDVLDAGVIGPGEPDRIDVRVGNHVGDRLVRLALADVELVRIRCRRRGVLPVRAPDAADVAVTDSRPAEHVELRVEARADEADA